MLVSFDSAAAGGGGGGAAGGGGGGRITTLAGDGRHGFADGPAATARFSGPRGVVCRSDDGSIFVADTENHRIRRISAAGIVTTFAGSGQLGGADGVGASASFDGPRCLAFGPGGALFVTEGGGNRVRVISPAGAVTTLAVPADFRFRSPTGIAVDAAGVVFVADQGNDRILRITDGVVDTIAGGVRSGFADGAGAEARFDCPTGIALDPATGSLVVADQSGHRLRAVDPRTGDVSTLAGTGASTYADGDADEAGLGQPTRVVVDAPSLAGADAGRAGRRAAHNVPGPVARRARGGPKGSGDE